MPVLISCVDDAELRLLPKSADETRTYLHSPSGDAFVELDRRPRSRRSTVRSAGQIDTKNSLAPGSTIQSDSLSATYTFDKADLGVFKGISGILSSQGKFGGVLEKIEVEGKTSTPDFTVKTGGHPVDLETVFSATVDGTNGDTLLHPVTAHLLNTVIVAQGGVVKSPDKKGRSIALDVTVDQGRLEDLMRLAVRADKPPAQWVSRSSFLLPGVDIVNQLNLTGVPV
jgi:hypothetical protein